MNTNIQPATSMPDGSLRECAHCHADIAVGSPSVPNNYGVDCHAACVDQTARRGTASATTPDNSDLVAAALGLGGLAPIAPLAPRVAPATTNKTNQELVCEAMGLTSAPNRHPEQA